ncbi:MAG: aspartate aminotransferase [Desulfuromonas sp.]|nr:MAG: aspartate aminotransferase [Desulfuromonas sp.]
MFKSEYEVHLNLNVRGLPLSATLDINEQSARLQQEGRQIYRLGLGQSPFPVPEGVVRALQENAFQKDYLPVKGLPALRDAVASYYQRTQGVNFNGGDILIGPGSKELMFLLQIAYYGELAIPTPSWVSYAPQAHIAGRPVRWLQTRQQNRWLLMPDELEHLGRIDPTKPRIVILNYPNNPTGCSYTSEQLRELADVARRYKMIVLSDEIYGELAFAGDHQSIARYYPEGTIVASGLSKWAGAGGWRLGTFAFPEPLRWLLDAMAVVASETFTATSAPIQYAAVEAFRGSDDLERYLDNSRRILSRLSSWIWRQFCAAGIRVARPDGAFYMFPDFESERDRLRQRGIVNSTDLCRRLLDETGVAVLPGVCFGRPATELTVRLAFVDFDGGTALKAVVDRAEEVVSDAFLYEQCGRVTTAIERMVAWVKQPG